MKAMKTSVVLIPSYEPDDKLIDVVSELVDNDFPVLVVNDGSKSSFNHVFDSIKNKATYLHYERNRGKGYALKYGYARIKELFPEAKYVITADGDGQHSIEDIKRMHEKLSETDKVVLGVRDFGKDVPRKSKFGNWYSKLNRSWATKKYLQDDQCGLRGYPVRYIPDLLKIKGDRYEFEMNQIVKFQMMNIEMDTLLIKTIYFDGNSKSHFRPGRDALRIHSTIVKHSIASIICNLLLISMIIVGLKYLTSWPMFAIIYGSYGIMAVIYIILINIIYRVKAVGKSIIIELSTAIMKMLVCHLLLWLTVGLMHWNHIAVTPFAVVIASLLNPPFAYIVFKLKKH